jgi:hypothetical protein
MTDPAFWKVIAVLGIGLLLVIAVLLALNLFRKRPGITPKSLEPSAELHDDGAVTMEAWNYLVEIDAKFLATNEPDSSLADDKKYLEYADQFRANASEVSSLAAQIHGMARNGVDPKLLDWATQMREWYGQWSDLYHEWATHFGNVAQFERDHTGIWPMIEGAWRGATQLDIFGRGNEVAEAQNQILAARDELDKQMAKLVGKRQFLLAERDRLDETYTNRWNWPTSEDEEPVESENIQKEKPCGG